jgi:cytochrome c biogenesis protein CcmG/thiol:disulfide interchange protein DsbE
VGRQEISRYGRVGWFHATVIAWVLLGLGTAFAGGTKAPAFELADLDGKEVSLSSLLKDGPVILDFWATWCKPCIRAFPGLQDLLEKYDERGLKVVAISVDGPKTKAGVAPLMRSKKYDFRVLFDSDGRVARKYNAVAIPRTVLVSPAGEIAFATVGYRPSNHDLLEKALLPFLPPAESEGAEAVK